MATKISEAELAKALESILKGEGIRNVIFPHGVKIVDFQGTPSLCAMTQEEYIEITTKNGQTGAKACTLTSMGCRSIGCNDAGGTCNIYFDAGGYHYCICEH